MTRLNVVALAMAGDFNSARAELARRASQPQRRALRESISSVEPDLTDLTFSEAIGGGGPLDTRSFVEGITDSAPVDVDSFVEGITGGDDEPYHVAEEAEPPAPQTSETVGFSYSTFLTEVLGS